MTPYGNATFVLIPQQGTLPIYQPFVDLANTDRHACVRRPVVSLVQPLTKVFINLGYDRETQPGHRAAAVDPAVQPVPELGQGRGGPCRRDRRGLHALGDGVDVTNPPTSPRADSSPVEVETSNVTSWLSKRTPTTVVDKDAAPVGKVSATPLEDTALKDTDAADDGTKNKPRRDGRQEGRRHRKATVVKVKTADDKSRPKKTEARRRKRRRKGRRPPPSQTRNAPALVNE